MRASSDWVVHSEPWAALLTSVGIRRHPESGSGSLLPCVHRQGDNMALKDLIVLTPQAEDAGTNNFSKVTLIYPSIK